MWYAVLAAACALAFAYACWDINDYDVWWHLNAGRWIVEHRAIPRVEPFTHSLHGIPWANYEWAAEPVLFAVDRVGGTAGLVVLTGLTAAAMIACLLVAMRASGAGPATAGLCAAGVLYVAQVRILPRPEIFSLLFLALVSAIVWRWRRGSARVLWLCPIVFLVWGNVHPGVLGGLLLLGCLFAGEALRRVPWLAPAETGPVPPLKPFLVVGVLSGVAVLLNPYGIAAPLESLHLVRSDFTQYVREWLPTLHAANRGKAWVVGFQVWLAILALSTPLLWRRRRLAELLAALAFLPMALRHERMIAVYAVATAVAGASAMTAWVELVGRARRPARPWTAVVVIVLLLGNVGLVFSGAQYALQGDERRVGFGLYDKDYPVQAAAFLRSAGIHGTMYNEYRWGGWLGWTLREPVFQDGRNLDFEQFMAGRSIRDATSGFYKHITDYGIDYFIVNQPRPGRERPILNYLRKQPDWVLVFWDDVALVYVKRIPRFAEVIRRYGYSCVDPLERRVRREEVRASLDCIVGEFDRAKRWSPRAGSVRMLAGQLYELAGLRERALSEYREGREIEPDLPFWNTRIRALGG